MKKALLKERYGLLWVDGKVTKETADEIRKHPFDMMMAGQYKMQYIPAERSRTNQEYFSLYYEPERLFWREYPEEEFIKYLNKHKKDNLQLNAKITNKEYGQLYKIAKENCLINICFISHNSDDFDFADVSCWGAEAAMIAAYKLGKEIGAQETEKKEQAK